MKRSDGATLTALAAPAVLAVGCSPDLVARCVQALGGIGVALRTCDFLNAATVAAERRPLALVILEDLYAFDPYEFDALARDVRASLVRVEDGIAVPKLEMLLAAAIDTAAADRGELLPAWPEAGGGPILEKDDRETRRLTPADPLRISYTVGQRLPSRADMAAVASATWPVGAPAAADGPPSSRPGGP
jgi:hypothetical protein